METKYHNDIEQQSPEWFAIRAMRMTASKAQAIGNNGAGLDTLCLELASENYSQADKEHYSNGHTDRGNELEPIARAMYELETGNKVNEIGFISYGEYAGCSVDGDIEKNKNGKGGLEIKCLEDKKHFAMIVNGIKVDSAHEWQMQMGLLITGWDYWDYVLYNPNYKQSLLTTRIYPDKGKHKQLLEGIERGEELLKDYKTKYEKL